MACEGCGPALSRVIGWRAWYDDGSIYSSAETDWESLPGDGMLRVILYHAEQNGSGQHRRTILDAEDYYWRAAGREDWIYASGFGPEEDIRRRYKEPSIKRGRWTDAISMARMNDESLETRWP